MTRLDGVTYARSVGGLPERGVAPLREDHERAAGALDVVSILAAVHGSESIDWARQRILSKDAKAGKEVWRPIHPLVWEHLQTWNTRGWLFASPTRKGEHVTAANVSNVLSKAFKRAGVAHRPHQMRAWFATEMIDAGASTMVVAAAMRHSSNQTVEKYVRVRDDTILDAMKKLPAVVVPTRSGRRVA